MARRLALQRERERVSTGVAVMESRRFIAFDAPLFMSLESRAARRLRREEEELVTRRPLSRMSRHAWERRERRAAFERETGRGLLSRRPQETSTDCDEDMDRKKNQPERKSERFFFFFFFKYKKEIVSQ